MKNKKLCFHHDILYLDCFCTFDLEFKISKIYNQLSKNNRNIVETSINTLKTT